MIPFYSDKEDKDFRDVAGAMASAFNTLRFEPDKGLDTALQTIKQQRSARRAKNKTVEYLRSLGQPEATRLANMVETGQLTGQQAYSQIFALEQEKRAADRAAANAARSFENQVKLLEMRQGYSTDAANLANTRAIELAELTNELAMKRDAAKPVKAGTFEKKVAGYIASGMPEDMAIGFASGSLEVRTNPINGRTMVYDKRSQAEYVPTQVGGDAPAVSSDGQERQAVANLFEGVEVQAGLGARGLINKAANVITDAVAGVSASKDAQAAESALKVLGLETLALADVSFAGKPTNFLRERVEDTLVIRPNELTTGRANALSKAEKTITLLENTLMAATREAENKDGEVGSVQAARAALPQINSLLDNYRNLRDILRGASSPSPSPSSGTFTVSDDAAAIIRRNLPKQSMLPSPN